jgi:hypothetical protein
MGSPDAVLLQIRRHDDGGDREGSGCRGPDGLRSLPVEARVPEAILAQVGRPWAGRARGVYAGARDWRTKWCLRSPGRQAARPFACQLTHEVALGSR